MNSSPSWPPVPGWQGSTATTDHPGHHVAELAGRGSSPPPPWVASSRTSSPRTTATGLHAARRRHDRQPRAETWTVTATTTPRTSGQPRTASPSSSAPAPATRSPALASTTTRTTASTYWRLLLADHHRALVVVRERQEPLERLRLRGQRQRLQARRRRGLGRHVVNNDAAWDDAGDGSAENSNTGAIVLNRNTAYANTDAGFFFATGEARLARNLAVSSTRAAWTSSVPPRSPRPTTGTAAPRRRPSVDGRDHGVRCPLGRRTVAAGDHVPDDGLNNHRLDHEPTYPRTDVRGK